MSERVVVVADDEDYIRDLLVEYLQGLGYEVHGARDGVEALELIAAERPGVVVLDYMMPRVNGLDVLRTVREDHPDSYVVMMTGRGTQQTAVEVLKSGAADYIVKPFKVSDLVRSVEYVFQLRDREVEHSRLRDRIRRHIGQEDGKVQADAGASAPPSPAENPPPSGVSVTGERVVRLEREIVDLRRTLAGLSEASERAEKLQRAGRDLVEALWKNVLPAIDRLGEDLHRDRSDLEGEPVPARLVSRLAERQRQAESLAQSVLALAREASRVLREETSTAEGDRAAPGPVQT